MKEYPLEGYKCQKPSANGYWYQYALQETLAKKFAIKDDLKVHISLSHDDAALLKKGCTIVATHLAKAKVYSFKICWEPINLKYSNLYGKEVTIYMNKVEDTPEFAHECDSTFWLRLFSDIECALVAEGIKPNKNKSANLADRPFPGSKGYIFYRNPNNILGRYVDTGSLACAGFTRSEAFSISEDYLGNSWFKNKMLHANHPIESEVKDAEPIKAHVIQPYKLSCASTLREDSIKTLLAYRSVLSKQKPSEAGVFSGEVKNKPIDTMAQVFFALISSVEHDHEDLKLAKKLFNYYLYRAALIYNIIHTGLLKRHPTQMPNRMGDIIPSVYHHFFKPLMTTWQKDPAQPITAIVDEKELIKNIVKSCLREKIQVVVKDGVTVDITFAQIYFDHPQYILALSEDQVLLLYEQAYKMAPNVSLGADHRSTSTLNFKNLSRALDSPKQDRPSVTSAINAGLTLHQACAQKSSKLKRKHSEEQALGVPQL